jgi:uncharacterized protein YaeQ
MAIKATIYKAEVELADMDRHIYGEQSLTIARHPSETDERMLVRLLVLALNTPPSAGECVLEFAGDLCEADEPCVWQRDLTGRIEHWIEVGQPDEKRILRASSRAARVSVYSFASSTPIWWSGIAGKVTRARNLAVWQIPSPQSQALAALASKSMRLQVSVQDGSIWIGSEGPSVEITLRRLNEHG